MIKRNGYTFITAQGLLPILQEVQRRIAIKQVSPITDYIASKGYGKSSAREIVHAMFDLKVIAFKDSVSKSYMYFNKVEWCEAPPTLELAQLIIDQKHENTKKTVEARTLKKIYSGKAAKENPLENDNVSETPLALEDTETAKEIQKELEEETKTEEVQNVTSAPPAFLSSYSDKELVDELRKRGWTVTASRMMEL